MSTRTFHPIGQGAFYSERISGIRTVYDCGIWYRDRSSRRAERVIETAFYNDDAIDILFISHFDYDHVGKIPFLLIKFKVLRIVMPLLEPSDRVFLAAAFRSVGEDELEQLIRDPGGFSQERGIVVTEVRAGESLDEEAETVDLENLITGTIKSGTKISSGNWIWVPLNFQSPIRSAQLFAQLTKIVLDPNKLSNSVYFDNHRAVLKNAYKCLSGNINENSMFLYSGPSSVSTVRTPHRLFEYWRPRHNDQVIYLVRPGCIFTGDGDLSLVQVSLIFARYLDNVGTIQIPHHGSKGSYNDTEFKSDEFLCPVSFGVNNEYGHPSGAVMSSLAENGCLPVSVTEKADSVLVTVFQA